MDPALVVESALAGSTKRYKSPAAGNLVFIGEHEHLELHLGVAIAGPLKARLIYCRLMVRRALRQRGLPDSRQAVREES